MAFVILSFVKGTVAPFRLMTYFIFAIFLPQTLFYTKAAVCEIFEFPGARVLFPGKAPGPMAGLVAICSSNDEIAPGWKEHPARSNDKTDGLCKYLLLLAKMNSLKPAIRVQPPEGAGGSPG
jgi:hypothetical protein